MAKSNKPPSSDPEDIKPAEGFTSSSAAFGADDRSPENAQASDRIAELEKELAVARAEATAANERNRQREGELSRAAKDHPLRDDPAMRDAKAAADEILRLREELARFKEVAPTLSGGRFVVSIKDGPTATIEAAPGESPAEAFFRMLGIHSSPHRPQVRPAGEKDPLGLHYPGADGQPRIKPFVPTTEIPAIVPIPQTK